MKLTPNPFSNWTLTQVTDGSADATASMLSYFDTCPVSADGTLLAFGSYPTRANWSEPQKEKWLGGFYRRPATADSSAFMQFCCMDLNSGEQRTLAQLPMAESHNGFGLQWLGESHRIAYCKPDFDKRQTTLETIDVDTGECKSWKLPVEGAVICPNFMVHTKKNVALVDVAVPFSKDTKNAAGIWTIDLDNGEHNQLISLADVVAATPQLQEYSIDELVLTHPKWSPDGERLLFVVKDYPVPPNVKILFVLHADGSGLRTYSGRPSHMTWHPDSRLILNNGKDADNQQQLVTFHCDSGEETIIASPHPGSGGGSHPSYSPDASRIVLEYFSPLSGNARSQLCDLKLVDPTTGNDEPLARFPVLTYAHYTTHVHPQWGRDSSSLFYNSDQTGLPEIYRLHLAQ